MTSTATTGTRSAADMPAGSVVKLIDGYQDLAAGTEGTVTGDTGGWAVWVVWAGTDRRDFVSCRYLDIVSSPAPVVAAPGPLTLAVDGERVTVTGSVKGDAVHAALLPRPWVWSRNAGGYVLPRSLTPSTRDYRVRTFRAACEAAGVPLEVDDAGTVLTEAQRRENRAERLEVRADRHEAASERAAAVEVSARATADRIGERFWMGQPILIGHHSEGRARRDQERMHNLTRRAIDAGKEATGRAERAENLRRHLERGDSAVTIGNRIEKHEAELRGIARRLEDGDLAARVSAGSSERAAEIMARTGLHLLDDDYRARLEAERDRLTEAVDLDRAAVAAMVESGAVRVFDKTTVSKGDAVKVRGQWRRVVRANAKTVACESGYGWTDNSPWREVTDHKTADQLSAEHRIAAHQDGDTCSLGDKCPLPVA